MDEPEIAIVSESEPEEPKIKAKKPKAAKLADPKPKAKAKKKKTPPKITMSVEDIQQQIIGGHFILSTMVPGAGISEEAAMNEAVAIKRIIDIYGMEWLEKFTPWVMLAIAIGMGEMQTLQAIQAKISERKKPKLEIVKEPMNHGAE